MLTSFRAFLLIMLGVLSSAVHASVDIAPAYSSAVCIGDSITSGHVPTYADPEPWPTYLQWELDASASYGDCHVTNLGVTSTTLLDEGSVPYRSTGNVEVAQQLAADVVFVMLGTNDSCDPNWDAHAYARELEELVEDIRAARADTHVVLMSPPRVFCDPDPNGPGVFHMDDNVIRDEIRPIVEDVATRTHAQYVDLYQLTQDHPEWFPDTVHPNTEGNQAIAHYLYEQVFS